LSGYFCDSDINNAVLGTWRVGSLASKVITESGKNERGEFVFDFTKGIDKYTNRVLFISGSCNSLIGPEYQERQMQLFPNAELVVIEGAGHTMFGEKPDESMRVIREYFKSR
jgi:pimeloyl-ACP methyl ester carboxylesterase